MAATGTLESRFAQRVDEYRRRAEEELPRKRQELDRLRAQGDDNAAAAERLEREIEALACREDEIEYLLDAMPFIKEYSSTTAIDSQAAAPAGALSNFVAVTHKSNKNNVLQRYLMYVEKQVDTTTMAAVTVHEDSTAKRHPREAEYFCGTCDAGMDFHSRESMLVCPACGECRAFTEMSANNLTYEQEIHQDVVTYFAYKRLNHFCEWLNSLQAKVGLARFFSWPYHTDDTALVLCVASAADRPGWPHRLPGHALPKGSAGSGHQALRGGGGHQGGSGHQAPRGGGHRPPRKPQAISRELRDRHPRSRSPRCNPGSL